MKKLVVLGYDQGIANAGCCILEYDLKTRKKKILYKEWFKTSSKDATPNRILQHYKYLTQIVKKYKPQAIACERLIMNSKINNRNKSASMMTVNEISAIIMLVSAQHKIYFNEFMPMTVKKRFTGNGKADKEQMIQTSMKKFRLRNKPIEHIADAIAIADTLTDLLVSNYCIESFFRIK